MRQPNVGDQDLEFLGAQHLPRKLETRTGRCIFPSRTEGALDPFQPYHVVVSRSEFWTESWPRRSYALRS